MIDERIEAIRQDRDTRAALRALRAVLSEQEKTGEATTLAQALLKERVLLCGCLGHSDPKVRKNAALLLGELPFETLPQELFTAYLAEKTRFVRPAYLEAIRAFDYHLLADELRAALERAEAEPLTEESRKHLTEERRLLRSLVGTLFAWEPHRILPQAFHLDTELILTTNRNYIQVTAEQLDRLRQTLAEKTNGRAGLTYRPFSAGLFVRTNALASVLPLRTYEELLFPIPALDTCPANEQEAARCLADSGLLDFLRRRHVQEPPFYFRVECREQRQHLQPQRLAAYLEEYSGQALLNSTDHYEVELRLVETGEGAFRATVKLLTLPDRRFSYRRYTTAAGIRGYNAALSMRLAARWLKQGAHVLDPFCGEGVMLAERDILLPAGTLTGLDLYKDSVEKAKMNLARYLEGRYREKPLQKGEQPEAEETAVPAVEAPKLTLIMRAFLEYQYDGVYDEIITNLPRQQSRTLEEGRQFYQSFFEKATELLCEDGILVLYSHDKAHMDACVQAKLVKKLAEFPLSKVEGCYLFVCGRAAR